MYKYLFAIITATMLAGCSKPKPPASYPVTISELHEDVTNVVATSEGLTSIHIRHFGYKEDITAFATATDIMRIVEGARRHNLMPATEQVRFLVYAPFSDPYGNTSMQPVLGFIFKRDELMKINFASKAFTEFNLINLYHDVWRRGDGRYSQNAIQAYCRKYGPNTRVFCGKESF